MIGVVLIDTSVFLNLLNVPGFNQEFEVVYRELARLQKLESVSMLLPAASILETGNHIAQLSDGNRRRQFAALFVEAVAAALKGVAPWQATELWSNVTLVKWLADFPDHAMRGLSFGDVSIISDWQAACARHKRYRVWIWSLDGGLAAHDRAAT